MKDILDYLKSYYNVAVVEDSGNAFVFYEPDSQLPADRRFPFITIVTNDLYDNVSDLVRPGIYRLNIGIGKSAFQALFPDYVQNKGIQPAAYDYTAFNKLLPHPVYGNMYWCCVLNPESDVFELTIKPLLEEAYRQAGQQYAKRNN